MADNKQDDVAGIDMRTMPQNHEQYIAYFDRMIADVETKRAQGRNPKGHLLITLWQDGDVDTNAIIRPNERRGVMQILRELKL